MEVQISNLIREGAKAILLDFGDSNFMCSAAIRVLLQSHRQMKNQQKTLRISYVSPEIDFILEQTGLRDLLIQKTRA